MNKTQAMEVARACKEPGAWARESDVRMECYARQINMPVLDGTDLRSFKALAAAILEANRKAA